MYKVDVENKTLRRLKKTTFFNEKLKERYDIQEWVEKNPEIIEDGLIIIGKEVPLPSEIRIDLLAIDKKSNLVIIELKRDDSGRNMDWQAIKYASYVSNLSNSDIFRQYAEYLRTTEDEAETLIEKHIEAENFEDLNNNQRIILVSKDFHSDVVSAVLWLRDNGIEVSCVRFTPYIDEKGDLFIAPTKMIPLPEAEDYLIKKEKKQKEVRQKKSSSFSLEKSEYKDEHLKMEIVSSLNRKSDLIPRVIVFLEIIVEFDRKFGREELKIKLFEKGIGEDIGQAGRYLSNISQFLTKKSNPHFRQIISFDTGGEIGQVKTNYYVLNEYRSLLKEILNEVRTNSPVQ
ncbi:MAG: hypothetical protein A2W93_03570 [Bacteroidetes bacterium GWF2_43_63]|nr:MAG: hypothetical protein A2W93_03570 [Bacteroidetes bacterium GWF2_43_63]HBG70507.1 hypothetical protein [Bacteroidales bacterium]HCB61502.1 hypothetical protein [Bacteroidales bacterium]